MVAERSVFLRRFIAI